MHAWRQPLLVGNAHQQRRERFTLLLRECGEQLLLVLAADLANCVDGAMTCRREPKRVRPAILRIGSTLDQPAFLQFVDERHHPTREHAKLGSDLLLASAGRQGNDPQESGMGGRQTLRAEPVRKLRCCMSTDLGQEKRGALGWTFAQRAERITK